jgi:thiol-disulfide isomerase/thioredoxin
MTIHEYPIRTVRAHELLGDVWFNGDPVPVAGQRGLAVLLFFWDYSCSASLRMLPYVKEWHRKYTPDGLVVVGIHTPKFSFGRDHERVDRAIRRLGITFPVVTDNGMHIWGRYGIRTWPSLEVIDKDGSVRFLNEGEGNVVGTERAIQTVMLDARMFDQVPELMAPLRDEDRPGAVCYRSTPELFGGYARGSIGNVEGTVPESNIAYHDPKIYVDGRLYLDGVWMSGRDALHGQVEHNTPGSVILRYSALEVEGVFTPAGAGPLLVSVEQDDLPLTREILGADVTIGDDGRSVMRVDDPRLYNIVRNPRHGDHVLRLTSASGGMIVYSFTFVASVIPELIPDS